MTFISMRPAYIRRSISFVDRFTIQRSFYYVPYSIHLVDRYIELLLPLDPKPNLLAHTSFQHFFPTIKLTLIHIRLQLVGWDNSNSLRLPVCVG